MEVSGKETLHRFSCVFCLLAPFTLLSSTACQVVSSQAEKATNANTSSTSNSNSNQLPSFDELWKAYPKDDAKVVIADDSDFYSMRSLRWDFRMADYVVYVEVKEKRLIDHTEGADCDNDKGVGYCAYRLTADIKEEFKGNIQSKRIDFVETSDADYPKRYFLGEHVAFLEWSESDQGKSKYLTVAENSTRQIKNKILEKLRTIVNPAAQIDEGDENEPYSIVSLRKSFNEAEVVAYVDAVGFKLDRDDVFEVGDVITAVVKKVFKGNLLPGQILKYRESLVNRRHRKDDLGPQVVYLSKPSGHEFEKMQYDKKSGKPYFTKTKTKEKGIIYENEEYPEAFIKHNILGKLRKISKEN